MSRRSDRYWLGWQLEPHVYRPGLAVSSGQRVGAQRVQYTHGPLLRVQGLSAHLSLQQDTTQYVPYDSDHQQLQPLANAKFRNTTSQRVQCQPLAVKVVTPCAT